jgi:hypothetical protein
LSAVCRGGDAATGQALHGAGTAARCLKCRISQYCDRAYSITITGRGSSRAGAPAPRARPAGGRPADRRGHAGGPALRARRTLPSRCSRSVSASSMRQAALALVLQPSVGHAAGRPIHMRPPLDRVRGSACIFDASILFSAAKSAGAVHGCCCVCVARGFRSWKRPAQPGAQGPSSLDALEKLSRGRDLCRSADPPRRASHRWSRRRTGSRGRVRMCASPADRRPRFRCLVCSMLLGVAIHSPRSLAESLINRSS